VSRSRLGLLALTAILAAGSPASSVHAADVADEAQFHFERGNQAYRQGRLEDALAAYYASNRLVENRNVQFNIARCLEQLKRYDEAFRAWAAVEAQHPPEAERATITASIDRLRPFLALVQIETRPPGASIYVNRRDLGSLGVTPKRLALREGKATLVLELPGHSPVEVPVTLRKGEETPVSVTLEPIYGALVLRHVPPGAVVRSEFADGEVVGTAPGPLRLLPGRRALFVSAPGYQAQLLEVEIAPGTTTAVGVALAPLPPTTGMLVVRANVDGALVRIDGQEMGFTPVVIARVATGSRAIEVTHPGRHEYRSSVTVKQGERAYVDARLGRADPEIVAATKNLERAGQAPASVTVLTADEIAAFGWTTLAEALAGVHGVFASNDRIYESVGFRGVSPPGDYTNRVLVLVDGHPFNDVLSGQGYVGHDLDVDLANVERIEVVRGPGSVLYGTGALFGVINVVTRRAPDGMHGVAEGTAGTLGTGIGRITASVGGGRGEALVSGATLRQLGDRRFFWNDAAPGGSPSSVQRADVETARHLDVRARLGPVSVRAGWNDRQKTVPTGTFRTVAGPGTTYRDRRGYAELRFDQTLGKVFLAARVSYDESRFRGVFDTGPTVPPLEDDFSARWGTAELRLILPRLLGQRLTLGAEVQDQFSIDLGSRSRAAQQQAGADRELVLSGYLTDDWELAPNLRVDAGLRADNYQHGFGTTLNPRLAVIAQPYRGGNTKLFVGRAFRAPSSYERFYNDDGYSQDPAGPLRPEVVLSADLEHAHAVEEDLVLVGTLFASEVRNLIELGPSPRPGLLTFVNRPGKVRSVGASAEVRWEPGGGTSLVATYSWQRVQSLEDGSTLPFPNAPSNVASLRALTALLAPYLRLGNELIVEVGRRTREGQRVEDAALWNVTLTGEYRRWRLRYFAGLFNLLDVRGYGPGIPVGPEVPSPTVPRYGRSARVGLSLAF
jgi:outer membrane receptor protein involved in Fe transport